MVWYLTHTRPYEPARIRYARGLGRLARPGSYPVAWPAGDHRSAARFRADLHTSK